MKLTPRVNFTNVLWVAYMCADPKSAKKRESRHCCLFALLGPMCVKAACWWNQHQSQKNWILKKVSEKS